MQKQKWSLVKELRKIAKHYRVKVIFTTKMIPLLDGYYQGSHKKMVIKTNQTTKNLLITFFHELSHAIAHFNGCWVPFHECSQWGTPDNTFDIEKCIDKIAKELWKKHLPNLTIDKKKMGRYHSTYIESERRDIIKFLQEHHPDYNKRFGVTKEQNHLYLTKCLNYIREN